MMDPRDLDRAIDAAAGAMMAREPGRSLGYTVMARVREGNAPPPRRFLWMTAAASLVLCGAVAIAVMSRAPVTVAHLPPAAQMRIAQPPTAVVPPVIVVRDTPPARRSVAAPTSITAIRHESPIAPIETEPIALSAIEVPQLERETTSIETLSIEPLTIEPLSASND